MSAPATENLSKSRKKQMQPSIIGFSIVKWLLRRLWSTSEGSAPGRSEPWALLRESSHLTHRLCSSSISCSLCSPGTPKFKLHGSFAKKVKRSKVDVYNWKLDYPTSHSALVHPRGWQHPLPLTDEYSCTHGPSRRKGFIITHGLVSEQVCSY